MNALLMLAAGMLLGLEALHQWLHRPRSGATACPPPADLLRRLARMRDPWGVITGLAIVGLDLPPRNAAGWVLLAGLGGWLATRLTTRKLRRRERGSDAGPRPG